MANTPEYLTIIGLTPELTNAFKDELIKLSDEFLAAGFINDDNADNLRNPHNGPSHRAASLVGWIRNRIQLDPESNYCAFIDVLKRRLADHKSILRRLDEKYKELNGTVETGISAALASGSSKVSDLNAASEGSAKKASKSAIYSEYNPLDQVIDNGTKAPVHIGQIAEVVKQWEGRLADELELSWADVENIKTKYDQDLKGQTREALLTWKERKGPDATYTNLIRIFKRAENRQCAEFIRKLAFQVEGVGENEVRKRNVTKISKERASTRVQPDFSDPEDLERDSSEENSHHQSNAARKSHCTNRDGRGTSKLMVAILALLAFSAVAIGWYIYPVSTVHGQGIPTSESAQAVPTSKESVGNRGSNSMESHSQDEEIKKLDDLIEKVNDLIQAVKEIGNWRGLCTNLGVDEGVMDALYNSPGTVDDKKADCLRAYFNSGKARWSKVAQAVAMYPINNQRVAKQIAKAHGLNT